MKPLGFILCFVLCLCAIPHAYGGMIDNHDGTVTDSSSNLMWQKYSSSYEVTRTLADVEIEKLNWGTYENWRLPTILELKAIAPYLRGLPVYDGSTAYWGNSCSQQDCSGLWVKPTYTETVFTTTAYVMAVRDNIPASAKTQYYNLSLSTGWNLFSIPLVLANPAPPGVIKTFFNDVRIIWGWDKGVWKAYRPDGPFNGIPQLTTIDAGKGYWIYVNQDVSVTLQGTAP